MSGRRKGRGGKARKGCRSIVTLLHERTDEDMFMCRRELRGKRLGCWCVPRFPCHAMVLAEVANSAESEFTKFD